MARSFSKLTVVWFVLTGVIGIIDTVYVFYRQPPGSTAPHPLAQVSPFNFWKIYEGFDHRYGANDDPFVLVVGYGNAIEIAFQFIAVILNLIGAYSAAVKLGLIVSVMTLYKTVMFFAMDHFEHYKFTGHNSPMDSFLNIYLPASFWVIVPALLIRSFWLQLTVKPVAVSDKKRH